MKVFSNSLKISFRFLLIFLLLGITTLACSAPLSSQSDSLNKESDRYLSFYEKEDGKDVHWEINFDDGEIASIYKNGERIPGDELDNYKDLVYEQLNEMRHGLKNFSFKMDDFKIDLEEFHKDMEFFEGNIDKHWQCWEDFEFEFDEDQFEENMEKLRERLKELKHRKFHFKFDSKKFKEQMKELREHLKIHPFYQDDYEFHFDRDVLSDKIREHQFTLKNFDFNLDEFDVQMKALREEMENLDINMEDLDEDVDNLDSFIRELKSELVKDGYLESADEDVEISFNNDELTVDDKPVRDDLLDKYKNIYRKHIGKTMRESTSIHIH